MFRDPDLYQKRRHNQLALVSRLPVEVLGEIFSYLRPGTRRKYQKPGYHPYLIWIPEATHVCHAWRRVGLHAAFLWQDIHVTASPSWALEFALRSKNAPLRITASSESIDEKMQSVISSCTEKLIQTSIKRVQEITLEEFGSDGVLRILSCGASPANERVIFPVLQHLEVSTFDPLILTDDSLCAPSLTSLVVCGLCSVDWKAFSLLQNLSYLEIMTTDNWDADLGAVHKALCQMCNLVGLTINWLDFDGAGAIRLPAPSRPAILPQLRSISLHTHFPILLSSLLNCIAYGPQRDLSVVVHCDSTEIKEMVSYIPSIIQHVKESTIRSLRIRFCPGFLYFTGWRCVEKHWATWCDGPIDITINLPGTLRPPTSYPRGIGVYLLNGLTRGLHFQRLASLSLVFREPIPAETWVQLFGSFPNLLMIDIRLGFRELCTALINDIEATADHPRLSSETNDCIIPFPALQSITVQKENGPYSEMDIDYIRRCLRKRLELKVPLKEICVTFHNNVKHHELDVVLKELEDS